MLGDSMRNKDEEECPHMFCQPSISSIVWLERKHSKEKRAVMHSIGFQQPQTTGVNDNQDIRHSSYSFPQKLVRNLEIWKRSAEKAWTGRMNPTKERLLTFASVLYVEYGGSPDITWSRNPHSTSLAPTPTRLSTCGCKEIIDDSLPVYAIFLLPVLVHLHTGSYNMTKDPEVRKLVIDCQLAR